MDKWIGKTAVVTGASSGIGAAILVALAKAGVNVIGLARRKDRIEALAEQNKSAKGKIHSFACDVTDPKSIDAAFDWIEKTFGTFHVFINNAGIWRCNQLTNDALKDSEIIDTVNTNFTGLVLCSRKAVKLMQKNNEAGYIININSIAGQISACGFMAELGTNVYQATKHGVTNISEILRLELALKPENKIKVSSVSPGIVMTDIFELAGIPEEGLKKFDGLKSEDIADAVAYLLSTPESVHVSELTIRPMNSQF
ncbi:farnesol dehydrogenase-like [Culicoides brevitarsis]|uniref:farnesol dehydrogenase-like n=1 Tax=Culicoides brevitarsis TaxID=469753 RepID=UPI00307CBD19